MENKNNLKEIKTDPIKLKDKKNRRSIILDVHKLPIKNLDNLQTIYINKVPGKNNTLQLVIQYLSEDKIPKRKEAIVKK